MRRRFQCKQISEVCLVQNRNPQFLCLLQLASCGFSRDQIIGLFRYRSLNDAAIRGNQCRAFLARERRQRPRNDETLPVELCSCSLNGCALKIHMRSAEFVEQNPIIHTLRWVRTIGDVVFIIGAVAFGAQIVKGLLHKEPADATTPTAQS